MESHSNSFASLYPVALYLTTEFLFAAGQRYFKLVAASRDERMIIGLFLNGLDCTIDTGYFMDLQLK
jgi:hypothetical protein